MNVIENIKFNVKYCLALIRYKSLDLKVNIMSIDETLEYMRQPGHSIVRFGDGEFALLDGCDIYCYQKYDECLQKRLVDVISCVDNPNLLVCMPEPLRGLSGYVSRSKKLWTINIARNYKCYIKYCNPTVTYGNSFVSRPYMIYKDKQNSKKWIQNLISIFDNKDIVIVEGKYSRSGVGNNLFEGAKTVRRIICPNIDAYEKYNDILDETLKIGKDHLILLAIGPTSKPLAYELVRHGYWVLDIGHIDSEYEWFLHMANEKIQNQFKHVAEVADQEILDCQDLEYRSSIICDLAR